MRAHGPAVHGMGWAPAVVSESAFGLGSALLTSRDKPCEVVRVLHEVRSVAGEAGGAGSQQREPPKVLLGPPPPTRVTVLPNASRMTGRNGGRPRTSSSVPAEVPAEVGGGAQRRRCGAPFGELALPHSASNVSTPRRENTRRLQVDARGLAANRCCHRSDSRRQRLRPPAQLQHGHAVLRHEENGCNAGHRAILAKRG